MTPSPRSPRSRTASLVLAVAVTAIPVGVTVGRGASGTATGVPAGPGAGGLPEGPPRGADGRCLHCHQVDPEFSHPVGMVPTMAVPAHLPLEEGRVGCRTCHDPHRDPTAGGPHGPKPWLRGTGWPRDLCADCHDPVNGDPVAIHAGFLGRAHTRWPGATPSTRPIEADSDGCLACHDGSVATDAAPYPGIRPSLERFMVGHPVGLRYGERRGGEGLVPARSLDDRIRLFDGTVECGSCHSFYAPRPKWLVVQNQGSRLCLSCHRM